MITRVLRLCDALHIREELEFLSVQCCWICFVCVSNQKINIISNDDGNSKFLTITNWGTKGFPETR